MKEVVLAGAAVTAQILYGYLRADSRYQVVATTVDDAFANQAGVPGLEIIPLSSLTAAFPADRISIVMAMGYDNLNRSRESMFERLRGMGYSIETYVHPDAGVYTEHPLGVGCVVLPSAVIEPHVHVGADTLVWCNVTLAHHSSVAEHCWVASGAVISGQAEVKRNTFIGVNATVVNEVVVGEYNIIGGGALVTKSTKPSSVHLARSAEELRFSSQDYLRLAKF